MGDIVQLVAMGLDYAKQIYDIVKEVLNLKNLSNSLKDRLEKVAPTIEYLATTEYGDIIGPEARTPEGLKLFSQSLGDMLQLMQRIQRFDKSLKEKSFFSKMIRKNKIERQFDEYSEQLDTLTQSIHLSLITEMRSMTYLFFVSIKDLLKKQGEAANKSTKVEQDKAAEYFKSKEIHRSQLEIKEEIGKGRFGTTYKANDRQRNDIVAIQSFSMVVDKDVLLKEAKNLLLLDSSHVVRLWGICTEKVPYLLVFEYMARGNLRQVLDQEGSQLTWEQRIQMALDGALGLYRIHHMPRPMLHLDIASDRFLVGKDWEVKISGVGLAETQTSILRKSKVPSSKKSTLSYVCPEILKDINLKPDAPTDIYSYGIVMWEIATGLKPYEGYTNERIKEFVLDGGKLHVPLPEKCPPSFRELIDKCRNLDPVTRPNSDGIVDCLQKLRASLVETSV